MEVIGGMLLVLGLIGFFGFIAYFTIGVLMDPIADWLRGLADAAERASAWFRRHGV